MSFNYDQYIRGGKLPHIWCPGCTYGTVLKSLPRTVDSLTDRAAAARGGTHFRPPRRRNIDITVIVLNNFIYGMAGGQHSPTTPVGHLATTMPFGNIDPTFNIPELAKGAGATWVGRGTAYHVPALHQLITGRIKHKGLAV